MSNESYKILIVEDDVIIAQLIKKYLLQFGHSVLDIVFDSEKVFTKIQNLRPDLIILDINILGDKDGIEVAAIIEKKYSLPYIFLTALSDNETLQRAKKLSPIGYIIKPFKENDLRATIIIGMSNYGNAKEDEELTLELFNQSINDPLTTKEFEILLRVSQGFTNVQIAEDDGLSMNTIKWHTQNIYSKLGVQNRTAATQFLMQQVNRI